MNNVEAGLADGVLDPLADLLAEMRAGGVANPPRVVRDALAAGEEAVKYPLLAWGNGINPVAIMWAPEVRVLLIVANVVHDPAATARAISVAIDVVALDQALAAGGISAGSTRP